MEADGPDALPASNQSTPTVRPARRHRLPAPAAAASEEEPDNPFREDFSNEVMFMSYLYSKLPETGVSPHIGTGGREKTARLRTLRLAAEAGKKDAGIEAAAKQAKGSVKKAADKVTGGAQIKA